jgi:hypothetical protein
MILHRSKFDGHRQIIACIKIPNLKQSSAKKSRLAFFDALVELEGVVSFGGF